MGDDVPHTYSPKGLRGESAVRIPGSLTQAARLYHQPHVAKSLPHAF